MLKSLALLGLTALGFAKHMPHHFGALHDDNSYSAALTNSHAFKSAVLAANSSETDRVVHVPQNARYTMMPVVLSDIFNVTFEVEGTVLCAQEFDNWPVRPDNGKMWDLWNFEDSSDLHLKGNGVIDGQGFQWWIREIMVQNPHSRPHLLHMHKCRNVVIEEISQGRDAVRQMLRDGRFGEAHALGDFLAGKPFDFPHHHCIAPAFWQSVQCRLKTLPVLTRNE